MPVVRERKKYTCTGCGASHSCPCAFATINKSAQTGVCKTCAGKGPESAKVPAQVSENFSPQPVNTAVADRSRVELFHPKDISGKPQRLHLHNLLQGRGLFLLASGPSLARTNLSLLQGRGIVTMGMNNTPALYRPNYWVAGDTPRSFIEQIWSDPGIMKFTPLTRKQVTLRVRNERGELFDSERKCCEAPNTWFFKMEDTFDPHTFLSSPTFPWGMPDRKADCLGVSGQRSTLLIALKMAWVLGAARVYLLGCDFKMEPGGQNYAFKQDRTEAMVASNNRMYEALRVRLTALKPKLEAAGMQIFNCTPGSRLTVFAHVDYEKAVQQESAECNKPIITEGMYEPEGAKPVVVKPASVQRPRHSFKGRLAVITPTRDRPYTLALTQRYLERQTQWPDLWVVASEGRQPQINTTLPLLHVHDGTPRLAGKWSLCRNMIQALQMCEREKIDGVLVFEDDDWYHPEYVARASALLNNGDITALYPTHYVSLSAGRYRVSEAKSLSHTGFRKGVFAQVRAIAHEEVALIDKRLHQSGGQYQRTENPLVVSLKGVYPGLGVTGYHANNADFGEPCDPVEKLREWIGAEDAMAYEGLL